ncbi:Aminotransferase-like, plant mobile domain [Sesbania bispinosa]|nr:Aminotransferase-like, plant mobile domain [Sesbania bispinosa]
MLLGFATFFGDFPTDEHFEVGPDHLQTLERAAFIAFWLSRYVFHGPPWESVSPGVCTLASLLAEGVCLPFASFYLGSLYGRLDRLQEQMYSLYGCFSINSCIDYVFIQMFLYERFPDYGPVRHIPKPPSGDNFPPEYRVQGWSLGHPRQSLINLIDDENSFIFRPYTSSFFPGVEGIDRIYLEHVFSTRINKGFRIEGVFDFWLLCVRPHVLPGFVVTDTMGIIGGDLFPFSYRPDQYIPMFGSSLFIPLDRVGRVLDEWVTYQHRLKASMVFYEGVKSVSSPHKILIIRFAKKWKPASSRKGNDKVLASTRPVKKVLMKIPPLAKRLFSQVVTPRRASVHLKARPAQGSPYCFPSSSFADFSESGQEDSSDSSDKSQDSPLLSHPPCSDSTQNTPPVNPDTERATGFGSLREIKHAFGQAQAVIHNFSVEVVNLPARVVTPIGDSSSLAPFGTHVPEYAKLLCGFSSRNVGFLLSESYPQAY